jgi:hypothetical protein
LPLSIRRTFGGIEPSQQKEAITVNQPTGLDRQYAELIETVWACERQWAIDDQVNAAIKYGRR